MPYSPHGRAAPPKTAGLRGVVMTPRFLFALRLRRGSRRPMEIGIGFPLGERRLVGKLLADGPKRFEILDHTAEIPVRIVFVGGLVIAVRRVVGVRLAARVFAALDE